MQAWGLMELARGNALAAVVLLERCAAYDPACTPVLKWKAVLLAKEAICLGRAAPLLKGVTCA